MEQQKPTVGRIVHYASHGTPVRPDGGQAYASECRAAIITQVWYDDIELTNPSDRVGLAVLNPTGMFFHEHAPQDEHEHAGGTWHWPERA